MLGPVRRQLTRSTGSAVFGLSGAGCGTWPCCLLDAGENVKTLSLYLGHSDPGFTLRTYTHLMPSSEDRTRRAIDKAFGYEPQADDSDGLATA